MGEPSHTNALPASAFADLLQTTQAALYAFVHHLTGTGSGEEAHDIVQDVYVAAWRAAQRGHAPFVRELDAAAARRWLFHVAYRRAISLVRHRQAIPWEALDTIDEARVLELVGHARPAVPFDDQVVEGEVLRAALAQLKPDDAACLLLDIIQGFKTAEIAQILGIAPDAARKRLSRAMERLRVAYFEHEVTPIHLRERAEP